MISYQFSSSCLVWVPILFSSRVLAMISPVSFTGILVYRFVISSEARARRGSIGVSSSF